MDKQCFSLDCSFLYQAYQPTAKRIGPLRSLLYRNISMCMLYRNRCASLEAIIEEDYIHIECETVTKTGLLVVKSKITEPRLLF